jgi:hypothetical protein
MYADGIEDQNVHDAMHRALGAVHDRLLLLESITGANPLTMVDSQKNPPVPQNPPPANPPGLIVQYDATTGFYTVTITAPATNAQGFLLTYHLVSSTDINFQNNVKDYGFGTQHIFTIPGPAGLFFKVSASVDGGQNFGDDSPSVGFLSPTP